METPKYSTDPQEQEIDKNVFRKPFQALAGHTIQDDQKGEEEEEDDDWEFELDNEEEEATEE